MSLFRFEWYMHRRFFLEWNNAAWAPATADQKPNENSGLYLTDRHYNNKSACILQDIKGGFRRKFLWPFPLLWLTTMKDFCSDCIMFAVHFTTHFLLIHACEAKLTNNTCTRLGRRAAKRGRNRLGRNFLERNIVTFALWCILNLLCIIDERTGL